MDETLRRAARRARTGDPDDAAALLVGQLRAGTLTAKKLRQQASKGDEAARAAHRHHFAGARTYTTFRPKGHDVVSLELVGGGNSRITRVPGTVLPGDRLVPIRVDRRRLLVYGSLVVEDVLPVGKYRRRPDARSLAGHGSPSQVVVGRPECPLRERVAPRKLVEGWCFQTPKGEDRPLANQEDGEVTHYAGMDGVFLLSDATAAAIVAFLQE